MELLVWQLIAGAECALVMWLVARCLRANERVREAMAFSRDASIDGDHWHDKYVRKTLDWFALKNALEAIANLDTPKAAHGVKKAVAIAREALS